MSLQELGSLFFYHQKEHQFHFIEELKMKVVVILHEGHPCPKLQNPILGKAEKNLLPWGEEPVRADEGRWKTLISGPHPPSKTVPTLPEGVGSMLYHGFCDSAQNDRNFETAIFVFK